MQESWRQAVLDAENPVVPHGENGGGMQNVILAVAGVTDTDTVSGGQKF